MIIIKSQQQRECTQLTDFVSYWIFSLQQDIKRSDRLLCIYFIPHFETHSRRNLFKPVQRLVNLIIFTYLRIYHSGSTGRIGYARILLLSFKWGHWAGTRQTIDQVMSAISLIRAQTPNKIDLNYCSKGADRCI